MRRYVQFEAPIPPPVRFGVRQLPPSTKFSPDNPDKVLCRVDILSNIRTDSNGKVYNKFQECICSLATYVANSRRLILDCRARGRYYERVRTR